MLLLCPPDLVQHVRNCLDREKFQPYGRFGPSHDRDLARSQINLYYFVLIELTRVLQTLVLRDF